MTPLEASLLARAQDFLLASALTAYPDPGLLERGLGLGAHEGAGSLIGALGEADGLQSVRCQYVDLFEYGKARVSLYETEYGRMRGMAKGHTLADIAGFYRAFGFTIDESQHEVVDHLAVELEFYSVLLVKQALLSELGDEEGASIVEGARRKFLAEHLAGVACAVAERAEIRADPIYRCVIAWCGRIVRDECTTLAVAPIPLDFFPDEEAKRDMRCDQRHLPIVS